MSDIEIAAERIVEKNAVRDSVTKNDVERHGDVNRIGAGVVTERVAVPHREAVAAELPSAFIERPIFFAEGVDVVVVAEALPDTDRRAGHRRASLRIVFVERLTGGSRECNPKRRVLNGHVKITRRDGRTA